MPGILVSEGEERFASILFGSISVDSNLYLGLYTNTTQPDNAATLSDINEVNVAYGYGRVTLSRGSWTVLSGIAVHSQVIFTALSGDWGNVYGYFIGTSSDNTGKLLVVGTFNEAPYNILDGHNVKITPKIAFR